MRHFAIVLICTALFAGVFGVAQSHDADSFTVSQTTPTSEPSDPPGDDATLFDSTSLPDEALFGVVNGAFADGVLTLNAPADEEAFVDFFIPVQDYAIDMNVTFSSYNEDTIFMFFLLRFQEDECSFAFTYDPAFGGVFASADSPEDCEDWENLEDATSPVLELDQTYNVRVVAEDDLYSLSIDGEEIISVEYDELSGGEAGVVGIVGPAEVTIEDLVVTDLTGGSATTAPDTGDDATLFDFTTPPSRALFGVSDGELTDGVLTLNAPADTQAIADFFTPVQDYAIDLNATFSSYAGENVFIFFLLRFQEDECNFEFAYNVVLGDLFANIRLPENCADWENLDSVSAPVLELDQTYNIRVVVEDDLYSLSIDGEEIISVEYDELSGGEAGVVGIVGPAEVTIEDLVITDLTATSGATAPDTDN